MWDKFLLIQTELCDVNQTLNIKIMQIMHE
jgi:hypothetical protein